MRNVLFLLLIAGSSLARDDFKELLSDYSAQSAADPTTDENTTLRDYFTILLYKFDLQQISELFIRYFHHSEPFGDLMRTLDKSPICHKMCRDLKKMDSFKAQRNWLESLDVDVVTGFKIIKDELEKNVPYADGLDPMPVKDLWEELLKLFKTDRVIDAVEQFRSESVDFEEFYQRVQLDSPEMQAVLGEIEQLPIWPTFNSTFIDIGTNVTDLAEIWPSGAMFVLAVGNVGC